VKYRDPSVAANIVAGQFIAPDSLSTGVSAQTTGLHNLANEREEIERLVQRLQERSSSGIGRTDRRKLGVSIERRENELWFMKVPVSHCCYI
jgi:hypothetical protein